MKQFYLEQEAVPRTIYIDQHFDDEETLQQLLSEKHGAKVQFHVPKQGQTRALMDLVRRNAEEALTKRIVAGDVARERTEGALVDLKDYLGLRSSAQPHRVL